MSDSGIVRAQRHWYPIFNVCAKEISTMTRRQSQSVPTSFLLPLFRTVVLKLWQATSLANLCLQKILTIHNSSKITI